LAKLETYGVANAILPPGVAKLPKQIEAELQREIDDGVQ
jgi:hypothetical protein